MPTRLDNLMENLIWAADGSEVDTVVARGRLLKQDGRVLPFADGTQPGGDHGGGAAALGAVRRVPADRARS